ncbi:MAG: VWA domain-containing protein, partial [Chloroflexi bacterium]|nr:VWA domain-containing protein [Chloroflexota bacterium]
MQFATPAALLLALLIPFFIWHGLPRLPHRRRRDTASLILRLIIVTLIILSLAGLQAVQTSDKLAVVFLVDASDSIDAAARAQAEQYIREAMARMTPNDRAGIVAFGKNALVERSVSAAKEFSGIASVPIRLDTNIAEAIRLGLAMLPADAARRLVILSDGVETLGNAVEAARLARALGVQIDFVPLRRSPSPEVLVSELRLPSRVKQGEEFDLEVTIESQVATPANITVLSGGALLHTTTVDLQAGVNNFVLSRLRVLQGDFANLQVRVDPLQAERTDTFYQNNALSGFVEVVGPPRVLIVTKQPEEATALLSAMREAGLMVDVKAPAELLADIAALANYKAVVLANVPAAELSEQWMRVLQSYVCLLYTS